MAERADYIGKTTLTYIGHAAVKITSKGGTVLYIDPWFAGDYSDAADYIFVTHGHLDHMPCPDVVLKDSGKMYTWNEMLHDGVYETVALGDITVQAVPAANKNHDIKASVGYIVSVDGYKIYHAGDTSKLESMRELSALGIDYAMFPIDGVYNMDAAEATEVAQMVGAKHNIPIHENDDPASGKKKSDDFVPENKLVLAYGETICLG